MAVSVLFRRRVVLNSCWACRARRFVAAENKVVKREIKSVERCGKFIGPSPPAEPLLLEINWNRFVIKGPGLSLFSPLEVLFLLTLTDSRLFRWQQRGELRGISVGALDIAWIAFLVELGSGFLPALCFVARRFLLFAARHASTALKVSFYRINNLRVYGRLPTETFERFDSLVQVFFLCRQRVIFTLLKTRRELFFLFLSCRFSLLSSSAKTALHCIVRL